MIQRIYQHAREEAWLVPGMICLDPFSGVALGGLEAGLCGVQYVGCELEERFHQLGLKNIEVWERKFSHLPQWVRPICLQGDSRRLQEVLQAAECVVSSPPYATDVIRERDGQHDKDRLVSKGLKDHAYGLMGDQSHPFDGYSASPDNLANLPTGSISAAISSPPYAGAGEVLGTHNGIDYSKTIGTGQRLTPGREINTYGHSPGQLGALPRGSLDLACSSPPYADALRDQRDSRGPGQTSCHDSRKHGARYTAEGASSTAGYGTRSDQLGTMRHDTFWSASKTILEQVFAVLKPGGHAIFVTKRYVRDSAIVEFSQDWAKLCQAVGLEWLHHHKAMLCEDHGTQTDLFGYDKQQTTLRMSFFRRLHTKKRPDLAILWEDVLCFHKPCNTQGETTDDPPCR